MTGFNLPEGCTVNDLPGNTPEDIAFDIEQSEAERILDSIGGYGELIEDRAAEIIEKALESKEFNCKNCHEKNCSSCLESAIEETCQELAEE